MKIYYFNTERIETTQLFDKYYMQVETERKQKSDNIKDVQKKRQSLGAGILLQHIRNTENIADKIVYSKYNKPAFASCSVCFNISHAGNYVVAVVSPYEVGIDTESLSRVKDFSEKEQKVMNHCFTKKEQEYICDATDEIEKARRFLRIWTIKEAYVKKEGNGIIRSFQTFEIDFEQQRACIVGEPESLITELEIGVDNHVSICHDRKDNEYTLEEIIEI